jgi:predicted RNA polymerase sigma factor
MEIQASRLRARVGPTGEPILLLDQDRGRWDQLLVRRGLAALERADALGGVHGPYAVQAAIAACHARARTAAETDWARIAALYETLVSDQPLSGGGAESRGGGWHGVRAAVGLEIADALIGERSLEQYHLLPAVRADFLIKLRRLDEARLELERAASPHPERPRA